MIETKQFDKVSFTLALDKDFYLEESQKSATEVIDRLQRYIDNGNSTDGLDFEYASIEKF